MTFTFTARFCLEFLPKPILRVQPDTVVSTQSKVIFFCEGRQGAKRYCVYKKESLNQQGKEILPKSDKKVEFSITKINQYHAGHYHCYYQIHGKLSEDSDTLELIVTGAHSKPSQSAQPSPVVSSGQKVTLQCVSRQNYDRFILTKEGPQKLSWRQDSHYNYDTGNSEAFFSVPSVTSSQRWAFRCYSYDSSNPQVWSEPSDTLELLVPGNLPKPIIKVEPGSVITFTNSMTIWCQGTLDAEVYFLYSEGSHSTWSTETLQKPGNEGKFFYPSVTGEHAGKYRCYWYSSAGWSEPSDSLELVVTGIYDYNELRLSALPSPVVTVGKNMTLHCVSHSHYDKFILTKEDQKFTSSVDTQYIPSSGHCQALFVMGPMTPNHTGTFRCYGYYENAPQLWSVPSKPLEIKISGLSKKPSLQTHQGHILDPGMNLTLQCCSDINYDRFALYKVGAADIMQHTSQQTDTGFSMTNFTLGYVSHSTIGQYRCFGARDLSSEWSASSDPLDIMITGQLYGTPPLLVMPNSTVHSGENVTLLCWSTYSVDTFILSKKGSGQPPLRLKSNYKDQQYQSEFSMSAVTSKLSGSYRCYGSQDSSLYLLSFASAPVELVVSGSTEASSWPTQKHITTAAPENRDHTMENLIRMGMAVLVLIVLLILVAEAWQSHRQSHHAAGK